MDKIPLTEEKVIVHSKNEREKTILVGIATPKVRMWQAEEHLNELARLAIQQSEVVDTLHECNVLIL